MNAWVIVFPQRMEERRIMPDQLWLKPGSIKIGALTCDPGSPQDGQFIIWLGQIQAKNIQQQFISQICPVFVIFGKSFDSPTLCHSGFLLPLQFFSSSSSAPLPSFVFFHLNHCPAGLNLVPICNSASSPFSCYENLSSISRANLR